MFLYLGRYTSSHFGQNTWRKQEATKRGLQINAPPKPLVVDVFSYLYARCTQIVAQPNGEHLLAVAQCAWAVAVCSAHELLVHLGETYTREQKAYMLNRGHGGNTYRAEK